MIRFSLLILVVLMAGHGFAQVEQADENSSEQILEEKTAADETNELSYETTVDFLAALSDKPLDLNKATTEDLQPLVELQLLSELQAASLLDYRNTVGNFISIYELQAVPYLDVQTIQNLLPFVKVSSEITDYQVKFGEQLFGGNYMLLTRVQSILEEQKGFSAPDENSSSRYAGSPLSIYSRFRYQYANRLSYGITAQKDAGEEFFTGSQPRGFDFYSAHFFIRGNRFLKSVCLGDYEIRFGQGLLAASGFGVAKSSVVSAIKYGGQTLRPYTSVNEFNFFRGVALVAGSKKFQVTGMFSYKQTDGNVTSDTLEEVVISSFGGDGYHRTDSEIEDKNAVDQTVIGANAQFYSSGFTAGLSGIYTRLSAPVLKNYAPYNQFDFQGDELGTASIHYSWRFRNMNLFGEAAMSDNGSPAVLNGLLISVDPRVDVSLLYRYYDESFQSLYANAFAESSTPVNEQGMYAGITIRPVQAWRLDAYGDLYKKPWLDFATDGPSTGTDYLVQLTYRPNRQFEAYMRWKDEWKNENSALNNLALDYLTTIRRQNLRLNMSYKVSGSFTLRSRAEWVWFDEKPLQVAHGFLIYQDVIFKKLGSPLQLTGRFYLFDTDNYDARIYAYENDVLYAYSIPAFQDRGMRYYLLARYSVSHAIDFWLRFSQTVYTNQDVIGSGLDEISGNKKSEIKAEMRLRF